MINCALRNPLDFEIAGDWPSSALHVATVLECLGSDCVNSIRDYWLVPLR